jgi:hypothetical protein
LQSFSIIQHQHSRTAIQLSNTQRALWDLQEFAVNTQKIMDEASTLRVERDQILQELIFVRQTLDPTSADFNSSSVHFSSSAQAFNSVIHSRMPAQHLHGVDKRDEYIVANKEYAKHLCSVTAETRSCEHSCPNLLLLRPVTVTNGLSSLLQVANGARFPSRRLQPRLATSLPTSARLEHPPTTPAGNAQQLHCY